MHIDGYKDEECTDAEKELIRRVHAVLKKFPRHHQLFLFGLWDSLGVIVMQKQAPGVVGIAFTTPGLLLLKRGIDAFEELTAQVAQSADALPILEEGELDAAGVAFVPGDDGAVH
jgi:uncharacterized membrane protein